MLSEPVMQDLLDQVETRQAESALSSLREHLSRTHPVQAATLLLGCVLAFGAKDEAFAPFGSLFMDVKPRAFTTQGYLPHPLPDSRWLSEEPDAARLATIALWVEPFDAFCSPLDFACAIPSAGAARYLLSRLAPIRNGWMRLSPSLVPASNAAAKALDHALHACASLAASQPQQVIGDSFFLSALDELYAPIFNLLFEHGAMPWKKGPHDAFASRVAFFARQGLWQSWGSAQQAVKDCGVERIAAWRVASFESLARLLPRASFFVNAEAQRAAREALWALAPDFLLAKSPVNERQMDRLLFTLARHEESLNALRSIQWILESPNPMWSFCQAPIRKQLAQLLEFPRLALPDATEEQLASEAFALPAGWRQLAERCVLGEAAPPALAESALAPQKRI